MCPATVLRNSSRTREWGSGRSEGGIGYKTNLLRLLRAQLFAALVLPRTAQKPEFCGAKSCGIGAVKVRAEHRHCIVRQIPALTLGRFLLPFPRGRSSGWGCSCRFRHLDTSQQEELSVCQGSAWLHPMHLDKSHLGRNPQFSELYYHAHLKIAGLIFLLPYPLGFVPQRLSCCRREEGAEADPHG